MMTQLTIKCVIRGTGSGILLAFVHAREVDVSSRNLVSRTFPQFSQSMLTPMRSVSRLKSLFKNFSPLEDRTKYAIKVRHDVKRAL